MDVENSQATGYRFGDVEVDARRHRVLRDGVELSLEPKAYAVLVELLRHAGDVVARDALLDAVWGHRHVTPAVLNRIVAILRRELGDEADHPRLIRTVHGVGYEFIGTPQVLADEPAPALATTPESAAMTPPTPTPTPPRRRAKWAAIALLAAVAAVAFFVIGRAPWHHAAPIKTADSARGAGSSASPMLIVLPLRALGSERDETALAEGLSEELTTRLSRIGGLGVICATSAAIAQSRQFDSAQLAEQLKATHALEGSLRESDDQLHVNLRLSELPGGRVVWTQVYDRPTTSFETLQNDVAAEVARTLSLRDAVGIAAPREVDPVALQRFLDVRRRISIGNAADWETQLRALVAAYPDYAPPHGLLGVMLSSSAPIRRDEAEREATRAIQLDPNEPHARIALARIAIMDGDWERAEQMLDEALLLAPADPFYRAVHGMQLGSLGYLEEGLREAEIGAAYGPLGGIYVVNTQAYLLDALGRHEQARQSIDAALADLPTPAAGTALRYARWYNAFWRRDAATARTVAAELPAGIWTPSFAAVAAALADPRQWPQARAAMDESERIAREQGHADAQNYLRLIDPQAEPGAVLALTRRMQRDVNAFSKLTIWMPERRALRQTREFQDFLRDSGVLAYWRKYGFPPQCRVDGDAARCD